MSGSRGWETTLSSALAQSDACCRFVSHVLAAFVMGMSPMMHPSSRLGWRDRIETRRALASLLSPSEVRKIAVTCSLQIKEVCRAYLAVLLGADPASRQAFSASNNAAGQLTCPPLEMPHHSLQAALQSLAAVAPKIVASPSLLSDLLSKESFAETRVRKKTVPKTHKTPNGSMQTVSYASTWLGGRSQYSSAECVSFSKCASVLVANSFKADFVPFWAHANAMGKRAARLDKSQFLTIHASNPAFRLCSLLSRNDSLRVQRAAMRSGSSSLMSVDGIASFLEWRGRRSGTETPSRSRTCTDRASSPGLKSASSPSRLTPRPLILHFARCALLKETMLSFDLGPKTRSMQEIALRKRLLVEDGKSLEEALPQHATCLMCCSSAGESPTRARTTAGRRRLSTRLESPPAC